MLRQTALLHEHDETISWSRTHIRDTNDDKQQQYDWFDDEGVGLMTLTTLTAMQQPLSSFFNEQMVIPVRRQQ